MLELANRLMDRNTFKKVVLMDGWIERESKSETWAIRAQAIVATKRMD
jgi:hypothetical protein